MAGVTDQGVPWIASGQATELTENFRNFRSSTITTITTIRWGPSTGARRAYTQSWNHSQEAGEHIFQ
eukprot:5280449-Pyramimonas_sp.AAC.1